MKVLVIGSGGREHALAWKLLQSPTVDRVLCVPGNGGTAVLDRCQNLALNPEDFDGIARLAQTQGVGLAVVGPEAPLALGIADFLRDRGIPTFGPGKAGAQLEASKAWAKELMAEAGVPTAAAAAFSDPEAARHYVRDRGAPIVIKADGLAAGKGVVVAETVETAIAAIDRAFAGAFGEAGHCVVVEEFLVGKEVSVLALTDGETLRPLLPAQDHKRAGEGDVGPNTGGMGAYAPAPLMTPELMDRVEAEILEPVRAALRDRGIDYRGVLYAGLMVSPEGDPSVVEFNCRFGDPEIQAVLPLLETPLDALLLACVEGRLAAAPPIRWRSGAAACVVAAAEGYPGPYAKGLPVTGLETARDRGGIPFHAGTRLVRVASPEENRGRNGTEARILTDGGRVLGMAAVGDNFDEAFAIAYQALAAVQFEGVYYRRDIGHQVRSTLAVPEPDANRDPALAPDHAGVAEES